MTAETFSSTWNSPEPRRFQIGDTFMYPGGWGTWRQRRTVTQIQDGIGATVCTADDDGREWWASADFWHTQGTDFKRAVDLTDTGPTVEADEPSDIFMSQAYEELLDADEPLTTADSLELTSRIKYSKEDKRAGAPDGWSKWERDDHDVDDHDDDTTWAVQRVFGLVKDAARVTIEYTDGVKMQFEWDG